MSYEDPRSRDRGAYTPPTDDDLPLHRGGFDARRGAPAKAPPVTLLVSAGVLLVLIVVVVLFYRSGLRGANEAPPAIGTPVTQMKVEAPVEAQPVDPEADIGVYRDAAESPATPPTYAPPPEEVQPRPEPKATPLPVPAAPAPAASVPPPAKAAPAAEPQTPPAAAATGTSAVQIGAFSSTAIADREYAAIAGRFPQFARGAGKRVQSVTAANGSTVFRTTFTGLSRERAQAFCAAIRAGGDDCLVR